MGGHDGEYSRGGDGEGPDGSGGSGAGYSSHQNTKSILGVLVSGG